VGRRSAPATCAPPADDAKVRRRGLFGSWGNIISTKSEERGPVGALIAFTLIAFVATAIRIITTHEIWSDLGAGQMPAALGVMVADVLETVVVCWLLLWFLILRPREAAHSGEYLGIMLAVVMTLSVGGVLTADHFLRQGAGDPAQARVMLAEMRQIYANFENPDAPLDMRIRSTGDFGVLEKIAKDTAKTSQDAARTYRNAIKALDYPAFVAPQRLAARGGLKLAKTRLAAAQAALKDYRTRLLAIPPTMRSALLRAKVSNFFRDQVLKGFDEGAAGSVGRRDAVLHDEDIKIEELGAMVDDLIHAKGIWWVKGGKFLFSNQHDLDAFNGDLTSVKDIERQEATLIAGLRARAVQDTTPP